jgi:uridine monophosphate synthetase
MKKENTVSQSFIEKLNKTIQENQSLLCLGLDPEISKIPGSGDGGSDIERMKNWCMGLIHQTAELICCIKPNIAFFEQYGAEGIKALKEILRMVPQEIPVLLDAKRGDIGSTAEAYAKAVFEYWNVDAVTLSPYLGMDSIAPFLKYPGKMVFILCKTSNPSAGVIQDHGSPMLFEHVAKSALKWGTEEQIGFVVGATQLESLAAVRKIAPKQWILAPGIGAQGGDLQSALKAGLSADNSKLIIPVSRSIIYAEEPHKAARQLRDQINQYRNSTQAELMNPMEKKKIELVLGLFEAQCIKFGQFTLASDKISPIYVDLRRIISYPKLFEKCVSSYVDLAKKIKFDCLAAVPYAALPATSGVAVELKVPMIYPRKEVKSHGTGQMIEGSFSKGETALLIEDVVTTGGSIVTAMQTLRDGGVIVKDVIVLVDRLQGGKSALAIENTRLHAALTIKEIVEILHDESKIDEKTFSEVKSYLDENCVQS